MLSVCTYNNGNTEKFPSQWVKYNKILNLADGLDDNLGLT